MAAWFSRDNYLPLGLIMNDWRTATVSGNLFAPGLRDTYLINLNQTENSFKRLLGRQYLRLVAGRIRGIVKRSASQFFRVASINRF